MTAALAASGLVPLDLRWRAVRARSAAAVAALLGGLASAAALLASIVSVQGQWGNLLYVLIVFGIVEVVAVIGWAVLFLPLALVGDVRPRFAPYAWLLLGLLEAAVVWISMPATVHSSLGWLGWALALVAGAGGGAVHGLVRRAQMRTGPAGLPRL